MHTADNWEKSSSDYTVLSSWDSNHAYGKTLSWKSVWSSIFWPFGGWVAIWSPHFSPLSPTAAAFIWIILDISRCSGCINFCSEDGPILAHSYTGYLLGAATIWSPILGRPAVSPHSMPTNLPNLKKEKKKGQWEKGQIRKWP